MEQSWSTIWRSSGCYWFQKVITHRPLDWRKWRIQVPCFRCKYQYQTYCFEIQTLIFWKQSFSKWEPNFSRWIQGLNTNILAVNHCEKEWCQTGTCTTTGNLFICRCYLNLPFNVMHSAGKLWGSALADALCSLFSYPHRAETKEYRFWYFQQSAAEQVCPRQSAVVRASCHKIHILVNLSREQWSRKPRLCQATLISQSNKLHAFQSCYFKPAYAMLWQLPTSGISKR